MKPRDRPIFSRVAIRTLHLLSFSAFKVLAPFFQITMAFVDFSSLPAIPGWCHSRITTQGKKRERGRETETEIFWSVWETKLTFSQCCQGNGDSSGHTESCGHYCVEKQEGGRQGQGCREMDSALWLTIHHCLLEWGGGCWSDSTKEGILISIPDILVYASWEIH